MVCKTVFFSVRIASFDNKKFAGRTKRRGLTPTYRTEINIMQYEIIGKI